MSYKVTAHRNGEVSIRLSRSAARDLAYDLWQAMGANAARVNAPAPAWWGEGDHKEWFGREAIRADDMAIEISKALDVCAP